MKKVLEGELLSLAHRVLQLKDREIDSLFRESKELYEKLLILKFYQDHLDEGRIKDVSPERLNDALKAVAITNLNTTVADDTERHQMPVDLVEEDYPIVAETEKEAINVMDESLLADKVSKIAPEVNEVSSVVSHSVTYDEPFITDVYIDESTTEEDDAQLHNYLDQHEAMLKQVDERGAAVNSEQVAAQSLLEEELEEDADDIEVSTIFEEEVIIETSIVEEPIAEEAPIVTPGVEEHMIIAVEDDIPAFEKPLSEFTSPVYQQAPVAEPTFTAPVVHKLEDEKVESIEETLVNINQQFASATFDEPVIEKPIINTPAAVVETPKIVEERTNVNGNKSSNEDPFFGFDFSDVEFVRVDDVDEKIVEKFDTQFVPVEPKVEEPVVQQVVVEPTPVAAPKVETPAAQNTLFNVEHTSVREPKISKPKSINDIYNTTIVVGLNDRIAFERHLFNGSAEDFNRVLSQLNTVSSFDEALSLIEHLVKPEYNNWEGKEEYAERFMALVEKRFI
ncbi:hypothetical protein SAMN04488018_10286 [Myroides marinus]|uniref:Uncharacterized protein n=1 Tax=Myroides marinus TaxID=703342 RepID=A0A1H6RVU0_9FLAO|nr:hypothetical protein [Myroides marinus]SEI58566.1 hypothetical protein SAMN04488018_10286 [Myroides marinus]